MSFSFSCLSALTITSSTVLNSSGESRHSYLISNLSGKAFSLNTVEYDVFLHRCPLSGWESFLLFLVCWEFLWDGIGFLSNAFLYCSDLMFFFPLFYLHVTLVDFHLLSQPWDKSHLAVVYTCTFLICCWIWFANHVLRIFVSMFIEIIGL